MLFLLNQLGTFLSSTVSPLSRSNPVGHGLLETTFPLGYNDIEVFVFLSHLFCFSSFPLRLSLFSSHKCWYSQESVWALSSFHSPFSLSDPCPSHNFNYFLSAPGLRSTSPGLFVGERKFQAIFPIKGCTEWLAKCTFTSEGGCACLSSLGNYSVLQFH